jgi:hypothetical protein
MQRPDFQGTENYVFYWWFLMNSQNSPIFWKADATIRNDVIAAIQSWTNTVPELTFQEVAWAQDVEFKWEPLQQGIWGLTSWTDFIYDGTANASYWADAVIRINSVAGLGQIEKRATIAHEIGHLLGLHERYGDDPVRCNAVEVSIMDAILCDGLQGPSALDEKRIYEFWSKGNMPITGAGCGTVGNWLWKDLSWAEHHYQFSLWYWNGNGWTWYYSRQHPENVGVDFFYEDRMLQEVINRQTYGAPAGSHCACGHSYFPKFNSYGTWQCQSITLQ